MGFTSTRTFTTCGHAPDKVVADVLDGDFHGGPGGEQALQWCRVCGACRRVSRLGQGDGAAVRVGEWRLPEGPDGEGVRFY